MGLNTESLLAGLVVATALVWLCRTAIRAFRGSRSACGCASPCGLNSRKRSSP